MRWYRKAAEQGHPSALNNLGALYESGAVVPESDAEADRWMNPAGTAEPPNAQRDLSALEARTTGSQIAQAQHPADDGSTGHPK